MTGRGFWGAVAALGGMQILAWGSTYYTPAVFLPHIAQETGWPAFVILGGLSLALLVGGVCTPLAARGMAKGRGAWCLGGSSLLFALGLACLGYARSEAAYMFGWAVLGAGMGFGLYDAAFSILSLACGNDGQRARRAITAVTLVAGFASTAAWPALSAMVGQWGWRETCFVLAAVHATLGVAVNAGLAGWCFAAPAAPQRHAPAPAAQAPPPEQATLPFAPLVAAFTLLAFSSVAFSANILGLLQGVGAKAALAATAALWFGPAQVAARLVEICWGARWHPCWTAASGGLLLTGGLGALCFSGGHAGAVLCAVAAYGAGNGLLTIARGTLPLALYPGQYVRRLGVQARCVLCGQALAPLVMGLLWDYASPQGVLGFLALMALVALGCLAPYCIRCKKRTAS